MDKETAALIKLWRENPFHYFSQTEARMIFGIGEDAMKALVALGAPIVAKKVLPDHLKAWLYENRENIGKLS